MLIARHAHATGGPSHRVAGTDPLTAIGRGQARELAGYVAALESPPDVVVCSTAVRAQETAEACCVRLGVSLRVDGRLCDRAGRDGRALPYTLSEQATSRPLDDVWEAGDKTWDGETAGEFWDRVGAAAEDLAASSSSPLVVCHLGTIAALVRWVLGLPHAMPDRLGLPVGNASITEVRCRADRHSRRRVAIARVGDAHFITVPTRG